MRYWWVNQNQTYKAEIEGGYIWSPKRNSNGARNQFYENMREVMPGDIIFSYRNMFISDVGIATSYCRDSLKPTEFGNIGIYWENSGWQVDVVYQKLETPLHPKAHIEQILPFLPAKYSPLKPNGEGLQSVYLASLSRELGELLETLIREKGNFIAKKEYPLSPNILALHEPTGSAFDHEIEKRLAEDTQIPATEKLQLAKARIGQGRFRENVNQIEKTCRVTGISDPTFLIASHIKPWRHSNNNERLDGQNGLMLSPDVDCLFDYGFISFTQEGGLLISPVAERDTLQKMGIEPAPGQNCGQFSDNQNQFLEFHRKNIFLSAHQ